MKKYENFCKSLANLHEGLKLDEPYSIVEQTGIVKLFDELKTEIETQWIVDKEE